MLTSNNILNLLDLLEFYFHLSQVQKSLSRFPHLGFPGNPAGKNDIRKRSMSVYIFIFMRFSLF